MSLDVNAIIRRGIYLGIKQFLGSSFYSCLRYMRAKQFLPHTELKQLQQEMLVRLIRSSYQRVPYYRKQLRDAGVIGINEQVNIQNYCNLPPLTKQVIREHYGQLLSLDVSQRRRIRKMPTGGTTGDPIAPYVDLQYWDWCLAETSLFYEWMGLRLGMPYIYYWGAPQDLGNQGQDIKSHFLFRFLQNRFVLNCSLLSDEIMADYIRQINQHSQYNYMVAYVQELYELALFSLEHSLPITTRFNGISVTTAELTEPMRQTIESVFHCKVYSRYGSREVGDIACECFYQTGLHINPLYTYVEVVDDYGQPVPPGVEGRILVTNLHNEIMPLLRYEIQDLGILQEQTACPCGRNWSTFAKITGRLHEQLILPNGSTFGKVFLHYAMEEFTGLHGYQLHQLSPDTVEVHLVSPIPDYINVHKDEVNEAYRRLMRCTENQLRITFKQVESLQRAPSGKRLLIIKRPFQQQDPQPHALSIDQELLSV